MIHLLLALAITIGQHGKNSLGAISYESNPYNYVAGTIVEGEVLEDGKATVLRIQPAYTYELYDESLFLCGDQSDKLDGKNPLMILTYEKLAHRIVDGVACHNLVGVNEIKTDKYGRME